MTVRHDPKTGESALPPGDGAASGVVARGTDSHALSKGCSDRAAIYPALAAFFGPLPAAVWVVDAPVGATLFANPTATAAFGTTLPTPILAAMQLTPAISTDAATTIVTGGAEARGMVVLGDGEAYAFHTSSLDHWPGYEGVVVVQVDAPSSETSDILDELDIFSALPVAAMVIRGGRILRANEAFHRLFHAENGALLGATTASLAADASVYAALGESVVRQMALQGHAYTELAARRADGGRFWVAMTGRVADRERPLVGSVWTATDISEDVSRRELLGALHDEHDALLNHGSFGVALTHGERIERCNRRFAELYGTGVEELLASSTVDLDGFGGPSLPEVSRRVREAIARGEPVKLEARVRSRSADASPRERWVAFTGKPLVRPDEATTLVPRIVWLAEDISERKEAERALEAFQAELERRIEERTNQLEQTIEKLHHEVETRRRAEQNAIHIANHDALTGLPNRTFFEDRLAHALALAGAGRQELALFFVDVDHFKHVNDTLGHSFGDRLVQEVAGRVRGCLREHDTIARLGGDEFVVLLPSLVDGTKDTSGIAERMLAAVAEPIVIEGVRFETTASIGIACFPADGEDAITLMRHADLALYQAKDQGRAGYSYFARSSADALNERVSMEQDLRHALARNELRLAYQPRIALHDGRVLGLEALLRWDHPTLGAVSPAKFVPLAEQTGLIGKLGEWALRAACHQAVAWAEAGIFHGVVAVNVSAKQLQPGLLQIVESALAESGLPPSRLELEITETVLAANEGVSELLEALAYRGVHIALDDFGTGYSNLAALQRLPISVLKIDRSLVSNIDRRQGDAIIARAMIQLAHTLDMSVIAEGVETEAQRDALRDFDCDEYQGYLFTPPLAPAKLEPLLLAHARTTAAAVSEDAANGTPPSCS